MFVLPYWSDLDVRHCIDVMHVDVNPFAQGLRMDFQRFFFNYLHENSKNGMDKEREKMASLWRAEWKGFGSKSKCVWMENDEKRE